MSTQTPPSYGTILLVLALAPEEIGHRIKDARERRGWTQLQFALEANVSPSTIQRWEAGKLPRVRELIRVADLLEVPAEHLVEPVEPSDRDAQMAALREELAEVRGMVARLLRQADEEGDLPDRLPAVEERPRPAA